jgi:pSer/pThr/pTyr-binding forkhead associated (FHA) protein
MIPTVTLRVVEGPHKGQEFISTDLTCITIGRSEECAFRLHGELPDLFVSRRHCLIEVRPGWIEVRDLESSNGTYVNGQRIGFPINRAARDGSTAFKRRLKDGDRIHVGTSVLQVAVQAPAGGVAPSGEAEAVPASAAGL